MQLLYSFTPFHQYHSNLIEPNFAELPELRSTASPCVKLWNKRRRNALEVVRRAIPSACAGFKYVNAQETQSQKKAALAHLVKEAAGLTRCL